MTLLGQLAQVFEAAAQRARELEAAERGEKRDWTDQSKSPLGRRRHVAAVRRRVEAGDTAGAAMVGRRALLSATALAEELANTSAPKAKGAEPKTGPDALRAKLGLVGGGR